MGEYKVGKKEYLKTYQKGLQDHVIEYKHAYDSDLGMAEELIEEMMQEDAYFFVNEYEGGKLYRDRELVESSKKNDDLIKVGKTDEEIIKIISEEGLL